MNSDILVREVEGLYVVGFPKTGALSVFDAVEYAAFHFWKLSKNQQPNHETNTANFWSSLGVADEAALARSNLFSAKLNREGWLRHGLPGREEHESELQRIYFTVTRKCNLTCPYCYQGLRDRTDREMPLSKAELALDKIREHNPQCIVGVTGGEPFLHSRIFDILRMLRERELSFSILTNGTLIDEGVASKLTEFPNLVHLQISLDGITEKIHTITRGESFYKTMDGISNVIANQLPFSLAPTIHERNLHEVFEIARFALLNGGFFSPNNLRKFPFNPQSGLNLTQEDLYCTVKEVDHRISSEFGIGKSQDWDSLLTNPEPSFDVHRCKFCCGMGMSLMDLDWNGEVYPCHLFKEKKFILGNIFNEELDLIFQRGQNLRTYSYEIPKCKNCILVSVCGGGCRAGAYYSFGSLLREDNLCQVLFKSHIDRLINAYNGTYAK